MSEFEIITNNHKLDVVEAWYLTEKERQEFDYLDWPKIDAGEDSRSFVRYKGELIDLNEMQSCHGSESFQGWDSYRSDSFFSGILVKWPAREDNPNELDNERVIVGRYYC